MALSTDKAVYLKSFTETLSIVCFMRCMYFCLSNRHSTVYNIIKYTSAVINIIHVLNQYQFLIYYYDIGYKEHFLLSQIKKQLHKIVGYTSTCYNFYVIAKACVLKSTCTVEKSNFLTVLYQTL